MNNFKLNKDEIKYIKNAVFIKEHLKQGLLNKTQILDNQIEVLEVIFSARLQRAGFDEDYKITKEGKLLENLLDKLSDLK